MTKRLMTIRERDMLLRRDATRDEYDRMRDDRKLRILRDREADETLTPDERATARDEADALQRTIEERS